MWRAVQAVSYPRSGHHLLITALARYSSGDMSFDSIAERHFAAGDLVYCEHYGHCNRVPCTDPKTNLQKNHDFDLALQPNADRPYLVQIRDPLPSIVSYFRIQCLHWDLAASKESWSQFAHEQVEQWRAFYRKWVLARDDLDCLLINYDELLNNPTSQFRRAIEFCHPAGSIDGSLLQRVVRSLQVGHKHDVMDFEHYDATEFAELHERAWQDLPAQMGTGPCATGDTADDSP